MIRKFRDKLIFLIENWTTRLVAEHRQLTLFESVVVVGVYPVWWSLKKWQQESW